MSSLTLRDLLGQLPRANKRPEIIGPSGGIRISKPIKGYIEPSFTAEKPLSGAKVVLIHAAGAVGKSSLAQAISSQMGCFLWDISAIQLGQNSFVGTLASAFGMIPASEFIQEIASGQQCIVIDGFDEAEMVSGWGRVKIFLEEIYQTVAGSSGLSVIMLSRAETAKAISRAIQGITKGEEITRRVSIDYFNFESSVAFIKEKSASKCDERVASEFLTLLGNSFAQVLSVTNEKGAILSSPENLSPGIDAIPVIDAKDAFCRIYHDIIEPRTRANAHTPFIGFIFFLYAPSTPTPALRPPLQWC